MGAEDTSMSESMAINKDLRILSREILSSRDDLLSLAEKLPALTRERAHQTAGKLPTLSANVQRILSILPSGVPLPESTFKSLVELRNDILQALGELDALMRELRFIVWDGECQGPRFLEVN
jgi:hypothetical protein